MMLVATILLGGAGVAGAKPPQWDKIFSGNSRFKVLSGFGGLADASGPGPVLPAGHPFEFISWDYWTATTLNGSPRVAILVNPTNFSMKFTEGKDGSKGFWCVRGGQGFNGVDSP